jgi:cell division protein FtsB
MPWRKPENSSLKEKKKRGMCTFALFFFLCHFWFDFHTFFSKKKKRKHKHNEDDVSQKEKEMDIMRHGILLLHPT